MRQTWTEIEKKALPVPIANAYRQRGHEIVRAEATIVRIRVTDPTPRMMYRVTSDTGNSVVWVPVNWGMMGWVPTDLKKEK